jgi:gamma-glutamyltranspeptidase/glutathione hydrolase
MPPPGAGRTLLLVLLMLNYLQSKFVGGSEPTRYHFLAETFRKAFLQRQDRPFDPNTYPQIQSKRMLSKSFAREMAASIIELVYGSKAAADGLGFLYNNYMMAFELDNPAHPYYLRPNAVPWSTAAPTIVFRRKEPWLAAGSPGSERIFSALVQVLSNVVDGSVPISSAVAAPRIHCSIGGTLSYEEGRVPHDAVEYLDGLGYKLSPREPYAFYLGCVQAVLKCQSGDGFQGVADPRRDGTAAGPQ